MAQQECSIMVDFESLGTTRDSVILSVGLVLFQKEEVLLTEYQEFNVLSQIEQGFVVSPETVAWWRKVNEDEFKRLLYNPVGIHTDPWIRQKMDKFFRLGKVREVWSRGYMDFDILSRFTWMPHYIFRDVRTLDSLGCKMKKNGHNALDDALNQVEYVQEVLKKCSVMNVEKSTRVSAAPNVSTCPLCTPCA